jgi:hypothetical protein
MLHTPADSCLLVMQVSNPSIIFMDEPTSGAESCYSCLCACRCCALYGTVLAKASSRTACGDYRDWMRSNELSCDSSQVWTLVLRLS